MLFNGLLCCSLKWVKHNRQSLATGTLHFNSSLVFLSLKVLSDVNLFFSRAVLSAVESSATQALRLVLTRRLAEVLLRGVSPAEYTCPTNTSEPSMVLKVNGFSKCFLGFHLMCSSSRLQERLACSK